MLKHIEADDGVETVVAEAGGIVIGVEIEFDHFRPVAIAESLPENIEVDFIIIADNEELFYRQKAADVADARAHLKDAVAQRWRNGRGQPEIEAMRAAEVA